jgi:DNA-dependent metalloprotease WSS1
MREIDSLISEYAHEKQLPREAEALHIIRKIASLVKPIMRARNWRVGTLAEFYPAEQNLLGMHEFQTYLKLGLFNIS